MGRRVRVFYRSDPKRLPRCEMTSRNRKPREQCERQLAREDMNYAQTPDSERPFALVPEGAGDVRGPDKLSVSWRRSARFSFTPPAARRRIPPLGVAPALLERRIGSCQGSRITLGSSWTQGIQRRVDIKEKWAARLRAQAGQREAATFPDPATKPGNGNR